MLYFIYLFSGIVLIAAMAVPFRFRNAPAFFIIGVYLIASTVIPHLVYIFTNDPNVLASNVQLASLDASIDIAYLPIFGFLSSYIALSMLFPQHQRRGNNLFLSRSQLGTIELINLAIFALILLLIVVNPLGPVGWVMSAFRRVPKEGFIFSLIYLLNVFSSYLTLLVFIERMNRGMRLPYATMFASCAVFWLSGGRVQFVVTVLPYLLTFLAFNRLNIAKLALSFLLVIALTGATLFLRLQIQGDTEQSAGNIVTRFASQMQLFSGYNLAADYVQVYGHDPLLYPKILTQIIPRAVYPDKPEQISSLMRYFYKGDDLGGITIGLFGEFYVMFGYIGCLLFGALFGAVVLLFDRWYRKGSKLPSTHRALLFSFISIFSIFALRGGMDNSIFRIDILLASFLFAYAICFVLRQPKKFSRARSPVSVRRIGIDSDVSVKESH